ncbi:MAG: hypothetical protein SH809_02575 [Rhodothermales bacterium]|nr:hypothetical protein [Rhodothermales bacterium]
MPAAEALSAIQSVKALYEIMKGIQGLATQAEINMALIDLQSKLLDTQSKVMELVDSNSELLERIRELKRIDLDSYHLEPIVNGGNVFRGRSAYKHAGSARYFCPVCFSKGMLTPLQFNNKGDHVLRCGACSTNLGKTTDEKQGSVTHIRR